MVQVGLGLLALTDVDRCGQHRRDRIGRRPQRRFRGQDGSLLAHAIREFFLEGRYGSSGIPDHAIERLAPPALLFAEQHGGILPDHFGRIEPKQPRLIGVGEQDLPVAVCRGNHGRDSIDDLGEALAGIAQGLFAGAFTVLQVPLQPVGAARQQELLVAHLEEISRPRGEFVMVDWTLQEVGGAGFQGLEPEFPVLVDGHDDDRQVDKRRQFPDSANEFRSVHLRHLVVADDEIRRVLAQPRQGIQRVCESIDRDVAGNRFGQPRKQISIGGLVVDDDDTGHYAAPVIALRREKMFVDGRPCRLSSNPLLQMLLRFAARVAIVARAFWLSS